MERFLLFGPSMATIGRPSAETPSAILRREHARLLGLADALQCASERGGGSADPAFWAGAVEALRALADHHHGVEEAVLLPFLEIRGFSAATRSLAGLLADHREHDVLLESVARAVSSLATGGPWAGTQLATAWRRYRQHLDRHLEREEHTLLPLADRALSAADAREVVARFEVYVELTGGREAYARLLDSASRIECAALAAAADRRPEAEAR
jgi:hemerythrin-like domain-containing protein